MDLDRAYSVIEVKAVDEGRRIFRGIATTPAPDRVSDTINPLGAKFSNPLVLLHQHDKDRPIGSVRFEKPTSKGIAFEAEIPVIQEEGPLKDRVDTAWGEIKHGLVRAVSIGFRPIKYAFKDDGGVDFQEIEIFELSAVTIPANSQATITAIKSLDREQMAALGKKSVTVVRVGKPAGASATKSLKSPKPKEGKEMNIQEQIKSYTESRAAKVALMTGIMEKSADDGTTLDAEQQEQYDTLSGEVEAIVKDIDRLTKLEKLALEKAAPVTAPRFSTVLPVSVKNTEKLEPGIQFARYAMCKMASQNNPAMAAEIARNRFPQNESIVKTLELEARGQKINSIMKATVEAGTTLDATWAAPLVDYTNFTGDFIEYLRPRTIIGQFGTGGIPTLNRIPFNVRITGQTTGGNAYWVGEGEPKPLTQLDFNAVELRWCKVATIAVLTNELIRFSDPSAERLVRDGLAAAVIERIDIDFIDPAKAAVANVSPASITNGVTGIVSSGNTAEDIRADIQALWAPFIAARNAPRNAVYIMDSTTALAVSMLQNPLGQTEYPGLTMNGGTFMGVPVIVSDYLPVDSGGGMVVLANASDIWLADDGQVTIDSSREASLQMLNNPTNNSATGTPTTMVSMFQTNSTAFLAERFINWQRRRASAVAFLTDVNWGAPA